MTYVYEAWMGEICLYVGVTDNIKKRMSAHRSTSGGWPTALTRLAVTEFNTRSDGEAFESKRIRTLDPANNRRGKRRPA